MFTKFNLIMHKVSGCAVMGCPVRKLTSTRYIILVRLAVDIEGIYVEFTRIYLQREVSCISCPYIRSPPLCRSCRWMNPQPRIHPLVTNKAFSSLWVFSIELSPPVRHPPYGKTSHYTGPGLVPRPVIVWRTSNHMERSTTIGVNPHSLWPR